MARLLFLGRLEDVAGSGEIGWPLVAPLPLAALIDQLPAPLATALRGPRIRIARNGVLAGTAPIVEPGDEIAFLPPVSGG